MPVNGKEIRLANGEWPPYLGKGLPKYGAISHIVTEAFHRVGLNVRYEFFPWVRALHVAHESFDGTLVWAKTPQRQQNFFYSEPVMIDKVAIFYHKDKPIRWNDIEDLKPYRVAIMRGYNNGNEMAKAEASGEYNFVTVTSETHALKMLFHRRIDIAVIDNTVGLELIRKDYSKKEQSLFIAHPKSVVARPLHVLLSRKFAINELYISKFNVALQEMKKDGTYDVIYQNMLSGKYKPLSAKD